VSGRRTGRLRTDLQNLPGVGPSIEGDLVSLGVERVEDLVGRNPRAMYDDLCRLEGGHVDRCVLYVFRCAVYCAGTDHPEPDRRNWWWWKDDNRNAFPPEFR